MALNHKKEENEKLSDSQDSEGNNNNDNNDKKKNTQKISETTITTTDESNTFDLTKSDNTRTEIIDILDEPDVAVWSKEIMNKNNTPADKVQEPSRIKSISTHVTYNEVEMEQKQSHLQQIDPANKEEVAKVIDLGTSLTDEATTTFIQKTKKETSS